MFTSGIENTNESRYPAYYNGNQWGQENSSGEQRSDPYLPNINPPAVPMCIDEAAVDPLALEIWKGEGIPEGLGIRLAEAKLLSYLETPNGERSEILAQETLDAYERVFELLDQFKDEYGWLPGMEERCQAVKAQVRQALQKMGWELVTKYGLKALGMLKSIFELLDALDKPCPAPQPEPKPAACELLPAQEEDKETICREVSLLKKMTREQEEKKEEPKKEPELKEFKFWTAFSPLPPQGGKKIEALYSEDFNKESREKETFTQKIEKRLFGLAFKVYESILRLIENNLRLKPGFRPARYI